MSWREGCATADLFPVFGFGHIEWSRRLTSALGSYVHPMRFDGLQCSGSEVPSAIWAANVGPFVLQGEINMLLQMIEIALLGVIAYATLKTAAVVSKGVNEVISALQAIHDLASKK